MAFQVPSLALRGGLHQADIVKMAGKPEILKVMPHAELVEKLLSIAQEVQLPIWARSLANLCTIEK
jgi:hypothetical protein